LLAVVGCVTFDVLSLFCWFSCWWLKVLETSSLFFSFPFSPPTKEESRKRAQSQSQASASEREQATSESDMRDLQGQVFTTRVANFLHNNTYT
jgi:hypothetical protein